MFKTLDRRLLPGAPRGLLALVLGCAAVEVALAVPAVHRALATGPGSVLGPVSLVGLQLGALGVFTWRARRPSTEREVWTRMAAATGLFVVATLVGGALAAGSGNLAVMPALFSCVQVAAFPVLYSGLVRWNRHTTSLADPHDRLNGAGSALAVTALVDLLIRSHHGPLAGAGWWQSVPLIAGFSAVFVLMGTTASLASLAGLARDVRLWLLLAAFAAGMTGSAAQMLCGGHPVSWTSAAWATGNAGMCVAAVLVPAGARIRPADPGAATIGAFAVLAAAVAILAVDRLTDASATSTCAAALAAALGALRLVINVRELGQLALSRREALTDDVTGAANRRAVLRRVEELCGAGTPLVLALLDLDKFKEVNDALGHGAGDDLLRLVARRLEAMAGMGDVVGRLGGNEFAVLVRVRSTGEPGERAEQVAVRLLAALADPFQVGGLDLHVSASIGLVARAGSSGQRGGAPAPTTPTLLLRQADTALNDAKQSGTGVVHFDAARHADSGSQLVLVEELRTAMATGQLVLHHQPQVDVASGHPLGVEALVRWAHPERGLLGPADFVPLAEVHGLMGALTDEVLALAVAQAARWHRHGVLLRVSVNLSASNLLDTTLPQRVADLLHRHGVRPEQLVLEVTESVLMSDAERSRAVLHALADLGTAISIDDFGTGYSSLTYLRELPVSELKLDQSFTADLLTDVRAAAIVASTIDLAHALGLRVVAEGVEDAATLARLQDLGCDEAQGYLHSRPVPAAELERWLGTRGAGTRAPAGAGSPPHPRR